MLLSDREFVCCLFEGRVSELVWSDKEEILREIVCCLVAIVCCLEEIVCCFEEREESDKECWRGRRRGEENLEENSVLICSIQFVSSDRSSYSDDVLEYIHLGNLPFEILSIYAFLLCFFAFHRVTRVSFLHWSIGPLVHRLNVKCQKSNAKYR